MRSTTACVSSFRAGTASAVRELSGAERTAGPGPEDRSSESGSRLDNSRRNPTVAFQNATVIHANVGAKRIRMSSSRRVVPPPPTRAAIIPTPPVVLEITSSQKATRRRVRPGTWKVRGEEEGSTVTAV